MRNSSMAKLSVSLSMVAAFAAPATAQTYADQMVTLDAQIQLQQKQKLLQDSLVDASLGRFPMVVAVMGFGGEMKVRLLLGSGASLTYGVGEAVNQRMKIAAIAPREVIVSIKPNDGAKVGKSGKDSKAVLVPLEFMAGAQQISAMGGLGQPGMPVQSGPIPPGLMLSPPAIQGGVLSSWPSPPSAPATVVTETASQAAAKAVAPAPAR